MKLKICFLALLCLFLKVAAQENITTGSAGLKVGDHVPDLQLSHLVNYRGHTHARISDFKGKLLILDFWSTYCGGCITAMPRLDSIQQQFPGRVVILPVSAEKNERVIAFWKNNPLLRDLSLPSVVEDKELQALFPHRLLPHDVWIGGNGVVLGETEAAAVNPEQIKAVLSGKGLKARTKQDVMDYDRERPLLIGNNGGKEDAFRYRSVITGYLEGLPGSQQAVTDTVSKQIRVRATNVTPRLLYALVYKELESLPDTGIQGNARETIQYRPKRTAVRDIARLYCYELILPGRSAALVRRSIKQDLDRFFGLETRWDPDKKVFTVTRPESSPDDERDFTL